MNKHNQFKVHYYKWQVSVASGMALLVIAMIAGKVLALTTGPLSATGLTTPVSAVWLPGAISGHLWVSDSALGFCRLDQVPNSTTTQPNPSTCVKVGGGIAGQASFDPVLNLVYVADASVNSQGAYRLSYDPNTETAGNPVLLTAGQMQNTNGTRALVFGPDHRLYLGLSNGQIMRITNLSEASQTVEIVGTTSNGLPAVSFSFVGNDLYIGETIKVTKAINMGACFAGFCNPPTATGINVVAPIALIYDGSANLFIANFTTVTSYNPASGVQALYATAGVAGGVNSLFKNISGLAVCRRAKTAKTAKELID